MWWKWAEYFNIYKQGKWIQDACVGVRVLHRLRGVCEGQCVREVQSRPVPSARQMPFHLSDGIPARFATHAVPPFPRWEILKSVSKQLRYKTQIKSEFGFGLCSWRCHLSLQCTARLRSGHTRVDVCRDGAWSPTGGDRSLLPDTFCGDPPPHVSEISIYTVCWCCLAREQLINSLWELKW